MVNEIIDKLRDKKIAILGFGKEGQSTYRFIRKYLKNQDVTILDLNDVKDNELLVNDNHLKMICGKNYLDDLDDYDLIIKAPGISLKDLKDSKIIAKITSQLELLLEVDKKNIIGITGTKGKSTTTSLLYQVLKDQGRDAFLLGNIGIPVLDKIDEYSDDSLLVIEMSSHQLEFVKESPHIGIILNLFQDHLDHDGDLQHYHNNKMHMFSFQNEDDIAIFSDDNEYLHERVKNGHFKSVLYDVRFDNSPIKEHSVRLSDDKIYYNNELLYVDGERKLLGQHNLKNIMFVILVARLLHLDLQKARDTIMNFQGLKYRMERIGTFDGITYYNDTIATIPEATISAIEALKDVDTLIFGGMDRGIEYGHLIDYLEKSNIANIVCMPTTGHTIGKILQERCDKNISFVETLEEAHEVSKKVTRPGKICLLSPAASSYEYFKNFEEKGKRFEEIVKGD